MKELRVLNGLSQEKLANLAEVPLSQIGRIERGEGNPTLKTLLALSRALAVTLSFLTAYESR